MYSPSSSRGAGNRALKTAHDVIDGLKRIPFNGINGINVGKAIINVGKATMIPLFLYQHLPLIP